MFLDFYRMREQPFGVTPDPRFLYLGESHREALASLFCGIEADRGFMALIAHPGLGKTTLTFHLLEKLQQTARTVFLFQTQCNSHELFHYILSDLGVDASGMDMVSMHDKLNEILARERLAGHRFVLAIDEAQNLEPAMLETIRLLSNFETSRTKLLQILLIGQPQLARKLSDPSLIQLEQRIAVFARLQPFRPEDTAHYIAHRLKVAGYEGEPLFTPGALRIIADQSQGIPRNINSLCFSALSLGCVMRRKQIDAEIMREVVADLNVESLNLPVSVDSVFSYGPKFNSRFRLWALRAVSVFVAAVGLFLIYSPGRIGRLWQSKTGATSTVSNPIRSSRANVGESLPVTPLPSALPITDFETFSVVVQPGDNLDTIARQSLGRDSRERIEQIQRLNPAMTDPDHIEAGQEIRLPKLSSPARTPVAGETNDMTAKNRGAMAPNE